MRILLTGAAAILAFLTAAPRPAVALIVYDANGNSNTYNTSVPGSPGPYDPTAALWNHVVQIRQTNGNPDASGVYLGNGFILTANHVTGTRYFLQGTEYFLDTSFNGTGSKQVTNSNNQGLDLKLIKILSPPSLDGLQMLSASQAATNNYSVYLGWGVGKGAPQTTDPATQGWTWGNSTTAAERWGRNWTLSGNYTFQSDPNTYVATQFNRTLFSSPADYNNDVYSLTLGDSGGGLFQLVNGNWMLAGIGVAVSVNGSSYYDRDSGASGDQPDASFYVSMQAHSQDVLRAIPEPAALALAAPALALLLLRRTSNSRRHRIGSRLDS